MLFSLRSIAAVSFPFPGRDRKSSEKTGERRSMPGVSKKLGRNAPYFSHSLPGSFLHVSYFSHSLSVSFPSRKLLETPATRYHLVHKVKKLLCYRRKTIKTLVQVLGLRVFPNFKYLSKYFAQIYTAQYWVSILVPLEVHQHGDRKYCTHLEPLTSAI